MIVCCCDGTVNGIYTAIYHAWEIGTSKTRISVCEGEDMALFEEYKYYDTDEAIALKVANSITSKLSDEVYYQVYVAALSNQLDRGNVIYKFLIKAFKVGPNIVNQFGDPDVMRLFEIVRFVQRENHKYLGFLRFGQGPNFLLSRIDPINNILDLLSHHFADRLLNDNFIIVDTKRHLCSVHQAGDRKYIITTITDEYLDTLLTATKESTSKYSPANSSEKYTNESIEELWEIFRSSIAIEPRRNEKLQQQLMPLRYRTYMNSYYPADDNSG